MYNLEDLELVMRTITQHVHSTLLTYLLLQVVVPLNFSSQAGLQHKRLINPSGTRSADPSLFKSQVLLPTFNVSTTADCRASGAPTVSTMISSHGPRV